MGDDDRIAIVGAGLAGLCAGHTLAEHGLGCTIYEASERVGGRVRSNTSGYWLDGQTTEWCGEFVDSGHDAVQALARTFGLPLRNLVEAEPSGSSATYLFGGEHYPHEQAATDFLPVREALRRDLQAAGAQTTWSTATAAGVALDRTSIHEWIETRVPGGHAAALGMLLDSAYKAEFGAPTADQSALNIVYALGLQTDAGDFSIYGESDERHCIHGGNDRLPRALAQSLPEKIRLGWELRAIAGEANGSVRLRFDVAGSAVDIVADHVVVAIPFAALRTLDIDHAGFDALKRTAIERLGSGRSEKLALQFGHRHWNSIGLGGVSNGSSFSDTGYPSTWDATRGQEGSCGILVSFTAAVAGSTPSGPFSEAGGDAAVLTRARAALARLEPVFPGLEHAWNGKATLSVPALDPHSRCSYPYYRVGQHHAFGGYEAVRQGNVHFAGDHCSQRFHGFMEGAAREGQRAAREILDDLSGA